MNEGMARLSIGVRDKIISIQNRTKMDLHEIKRVVFYLKEKYEINTEDALRKIVNYAIDKKLDLEVIEKKGPKSKYICAYVKNLEEL